MASRIATPRYCIQHSRFAKQDGWRLRDLSLSLHGNIAVTGYNENTHQTSIDVYTDVRHSNSRDKPKIIFSKEFEKYQREMESHRGRYVSFIENDVLVSCLGDKLEVLQVNKDEVLRSRRVYGISRCLSVRERREIFIGFYQSNKVTVYDVIDLNEIKSIILYGIQSGYYPFDMTVIADRIFVCVGEDKKGSNDKLLIFGEKSGRILSELTKRTDAVNWYVSSVGVNMNTLGIAGVVWWDSYYYKEDEYNTVVFYSLLSENNCSFLIVEVEFGVLRIRISDRGDSMITGNQWTGEVKVYDMAEIFTYSHFKEKLASSLQTYECTRLANFFEVPKDQADVILSSDKPSTNLLLAFEEKNILQPYNNDRLIEAFAKLRTNPFCCHIAEIFLKTRPSSFFQDVVKKLDEEMKSLQMTYEEERRHLKENVDALQEKLRRLSEAHQTLTQERSQSQAERYGKQVQLSSLNEDLQVSKQAHEETRKALQQTKELNQKMALVRNQFKVERDESQVKLSRLQRELQASKESQTQTEKVLKQTEERLQKVIQEKMEIETELKQWQMKHSFQSMTLEEERKRPTKSRKKTSIDMADGSSQVDSAFKSKYFPESSLGDEFGKLMVKVSVKLKNRNCIALATYFNLPETKIDLLHKETDMPGLTLLQILKERNIINIYDVSQLQEALAVLHLVEVNETLVIPYQNQIDPVIQQKNKITRTEH
ncbi:hypothetical protein HOLleu_21646 [Holothuria leucospilota]|uniref:Uncharacterized protein n=1 Tax=Holothuria leucospilota TaxID=206669 RepID=A0A9Q1H6Y5_HOLLE|nr:hypothetical protein HOLleu_21646 [Holothuria leucospilota]